MKKIIYLFILFLYISMVEFVPLAIAEEKLLLTKRDAKDISYKLIDYLDNIRAEYAYYALRYDDDSYFPEERKQEVLEYITNNYLQKYFFHQLSRANGINLMARVSNIAMAKLLFIHGGDPMHGSDKTFLNRPPLKAIMGVYGTVQNIPKLTHDEIITRRDWGDSLPSNIIIALAKLYISLGADIFDGKEWLPTIGLETTLILGVIGEEVGSKVSDELFIFPDEKHRADDIKPPEEGEYHYEGTSYFYRSPVTYWLEEFIESGYSAEMLDTHKLHYPRYMKRVSVEDIKKMLDNPKAHIIKANINCNEDFCPLTPSINMRDARGRTPLHIAGNEGNEAVYNYLKNNGADASIMDYRKNLAMLKTN